MLIASSLVTTCFLLAFPTKNEEERATIRKASNNSSDFTRIASYVETDITYKNKLLESQRPLHQKTKT
jgi:hypothetical protein